MTRSYARMVGATALSLGLSIAGCAMQPTSIGTKLDDSVITSRVKTALVADPDVKGTEVKVETVNGAVQLSGFVLSRAEAERAADIAARVNGVNRVINDIVVRSTPR